MAYDVRVGSFEGPLDLLLHLVETRKFNIWDIPVAEITEQYLDYLRQMQKLSLEVASEFVVMAARLLEIKSRMLLPRSPKPGEAEAEEADPRLALSQRLAVYRAFKYLAGHLSELEERRKPVWTRPRSVKSPEILRPAGPVSSVDALIEAWQRVLWRAFAENRPATVDRDELRIEDWVRAVTARLRRARALTFADLVGEKRNRARVVVTLLALLELMKERRVRCVQEVVFGDIWIAWIDEGVEKDGTRLDVSD
ncbi:segregation and condensation protein A [Kyrpidia spormannii]|uniref:Segregation and condensation protein A n=1 Tax=Kyrpidia spormannii TaxID=2055160 RepID=A0A6F9E7E5_9BACL|nr:segregation/condensation protein A [Kyrpidia spormannii]CAB3392789.1 chromosome condensation and partitioning factor [Kyrpidia spormannii]